MYPTSFLLMSFWYLREQIRVSFNNIEKILHRLAWNTGLIVNKDKSKIFCGKSCQNKDELKDLIAIQEGVLPKRYLGLPLSINY